MVRTLYILQGGMVAAFDAQGNQVPEWQGHVSDLLIEAMMKLQAADQETEFHWRDANGSIQETTGALVLAARDRHAQ